jgi:hypothetical protein
MSAGIDRLLDESGVRTREPIFWLGVGQDPVIYRGICGTTR